MKISKKILEIVNKLCFNSFYFTSFRHMKHIALRHLHRVIPPQGIDQLKARKHAVE
jgi:hypothetical protein